MLTEQSRARSLKTSRIYFCDFFFLKCYLLKCYQPDGLSINGVVSLLHYMSSMRQDIRSMMAISRSFPLSFLFYNLHKVLFVYL